MSVATKTCPDCGRIYIGHAGYHAERCTGPRLCRIPSCPNRAKHTLNGERYCDPHYWEAHATECECPPGWRHEPDCPLVREGEAA